MKSVFALAIVAASLTAAAPANDWSKPCFDGECAYDLQGTSEAGSGTFKIAGSPKSVADITPAAGWVILDCDPHLLEQEIRLVCKGDDEAACAHLFDHGPEHKVVRLPESCGAGPFGRIASASVATDQTIPGHIHEQLTRRDGVDPQVHVLKVDTAWNLADASKTGEVKFAFLGSTLPGPVGIMNYNNFSAREVDLAKRDTDKWTDYFQKAVDALKKYAKDFIDGLPDKTKVQWEAEKVKISYESGGEKKLDIFPKQSLDCKWGKASVEAHVTAKYSINGHVGGAMTGTLVPPHVAEVAVLAGFSGEADLRLHINAQAEASGEVPWPILPTVNPTPLQVTGVISLGPHFGIEAVAKAAIKLSGDIDIGANLIVKDIEFWYPPKAVSENVHEVQKKDSPLTLNADVEAKGSITGSLHVIPKLSLGIHGLGGQAEASAWVTFDGYISADIKGEGHAGVTNKREHARDLATRSAGAGFSGSVEVKCGFDVKGGLTGKLLGAKVEPEASIFTHAWSLYKQTFSGGKAKRDFTEISESSLVARAPAITDGLTCPTLKPNLFSFPKK